MNLTGRNLAAKFPEICDGAEGYARALGAEHGANAADWFEQDTTGGHVTDNAAAERAARAIVRGIEDGDPLILDALPAPDLSGQWADELTGPELVKDAIEESCWKLDIGRKSHWPNAGIDCPNDCPVCAAVESAQDMALGDICDAYEFAFSDAATARIAELCRAYLDREEE